MLDNYFLPPPFGSLLPLDFLFSLGKAPLSIHYSTTKATHKLHWCVTCCVLGSSISSPSSSNTTLLFTWRFFFRSFLTTAYLVKGFFFLLSDFWDSSASCESCESSGGRYIFWSFALLRKSSSSSLSSVEKILSHNAFYKYLVVCRNKGFSTLSSIFFPKHQATNTKPLLNTHLHQSQVLWALRWGQKCLAQTVLCCRLVAYWLCCLPSAWAASL